MQIRFCDHICDLCNFIYIELVQFTVHAYTACGVEEPKNENGLENFFLVYYTVTTISGSQGRKKYDETPFAFVTMKVI